MDTVAYMGTQASPMETGKRKTVMERRTEKHVNDKDLEDKIMDKKRKRENGRRLIRYVGGSFDF